MAEQTYPITGIPLVPGAPLPVRQEITAWYTNSDNKYQVSLFVQALQIFKGIHVTERLSFFQVAGVILSSPRSFALYAKLDRNS